MGEKHGENNHIPDAILLTRVSALSSAIEQSITTRNTDVSSIETRESIVSALRPHIVRSRRCGTMTAKIAASPMPRDPRDRLALLACRLGLDHHGSVCALLELGRFASAAALVRPISDALLTAAWAAYCIPAERARALLEDEDVFVPDTWELWRDGKANQQIGAMAEKMHVAMRTDGKILHKFVHGDMPQLDRQYGSGPTFDLRENLATLLMADTFIIGIGQLAGIASGQGDVTDRCNAALAELNQAIIRELGVEPLPQIVALPVPHAPRV